MIDLSAEAPARRAALVELDGLDRALVCLSSPLGIELSAMPEMAGRNPLLRSHSSDQAGTTDAVLRRFAGFLFPSCSPEIVSARHGSVRKP